MAVSMGAQFWFDILNKLVNVRLVGKRPDCSDDNTGKGPTTVPVPVPVDPRSPGRVI
jgi:hypothetical protein